MNFAKRIHTKNDRTAAQAVRGLDRIAPALREASEESMSTMHPLVRVLVGLGCAALVAGAAFAAPARPAAPSAANTPHIERTVPVTSVPVLSTTQIDVQELLRQQARAPRVANQAPRILIQNELDGEGGIAPQDELGLPAPANFKMGASINTPSPNPTTSFAGLDDIAMVDSSYIIIPPDVNGVVGRNHVFQNLNNNVRILDKSTGTVLSTVGVNTWWASTGASANNFTDPRSTYDPYNDRYITMVQGDLDKTTANSICLGVSDTNDPTSTWHLVRFSCYENAMYQYADFPVIGFNKNWIAISINMYTSAQTQVRRSVFMVHYPTLLTSHTATVFRADYGTSNVICGAPVVTYSATCDTEFVMQRRGTSTYSMDMIVGTGPSAPTYVVGAALTRPGGTWSALGTSNYYPQSAPVSGTSACGTTPCAIERSDDNFRTSPMYRNGSIWTAQQVGLPSTATHVGIQWTQVTTPSGAFVIGGRLQDTLATTTNGRPFYGEPSIAVNKNGDFLLGFTRFSSQMHPGAGYAMHVEADGAGTLRDTVIYKVGDDYYHKTFSTATGRNRWGDFSTTMVDPTDDLSFWTVNEYAKARAATDDGNTGSNSSKWGTWWAMVTPAPTFAISASAGTGGSITPSGTVNVNQGTNQVFTITPASCYSISDVQVDGASQGAISSYTFTNVQATHTISATFTQNGPYTIAASAGANGSISPSGSVNATCGSTQVFSITPAGCYHVADVLVDGVSKGAVTSYSFTNVQASHSISATFAINGPYTITASAGANGSISPSGAVGETCGSTQAFAIAADANYHIAGVTVDGASQGAIAGYTFSNVQANHTIAATFAITTYTITATAGANGAITPSGVATVNSGTDHAYAIAANSGFYLSDLQVDGASVTPAPGYTFTNVQASHTIAATFASDAAVIAAGSGSATLGPNHTCETLPVTLTRNGTTPVLGYSVTFQLSPELALCGGTAGITEGTFLSNAGATLFNVINHGSGSYTVDCALTQNCGPVALTGNLFSIGVTSSSTNSSGSVTMSSFKLRDCNNATLSAIAGSPGTVAIDNVGPSVSVFGPNGGESVTIDSSMPVSWSASDPSGVTSVAILLSRTGAAGSFDTLATGLSNSASPYAWTVTGPATTDAFVKVVALDGMGNYGADLSDAAFAINSVTGVGTSRPTAFALGAVVPNPGRGRETITYALPRDAHVRVSIVDLQGREVSVIANGTQSAGLHQVTWNGETPNGKAVAGVYFVRYQTPVKTFVQRFVVMQ